MTDRLDRSAKLDAAICGGIFILLLLCNLLSAYYADDFRYFFSFLDDKRIENPWQIVNSMRAHRYRMNGRLVAHSLVQLFGMLPGWVFDIVNAAMFTMEAKLVCDLATDGRRSNLTMIAVFCVLWLFTPMFGEVNLWQDGAVNYLWGIVFCLVYLKYFVSFFLHGRPIQSTLGKVVFLCLAFGAGAYSETTSAAAIFMAFAFLMLARVRRKEKISAFWVWAVVIAFLGYVSIYLAPAQWREKAAEGSASVLIQNFLTVAKLYWKLGGVLLCAFGVMLVGNLLLRTDKNVILMALVFLAGSLAANFILMFASYHVPRSTIGSFAYLVVANGILLYPLLETGRLKKWLAWGTALLVLITVPQIVSGVADIGETYQHMKKNEEYIYECKEKGMEDIEVPVFSTKTKYSEVNGGGYLNTEDPTTWPNDSMALYYGVHSLIGVEPE